MRMGKRITAALLSLMMIAAMSAGAYADVTGTITVDNPISGQTYTAYKIFDAAYDTENDGTAGEHYSYTIDSGSAWFSTVKTYANAPGSGMKLELVAGTCYAVATDSAFSAPAFAKAMKAAVDGGAVTDSGIVLTDNGSGEKQATGLPLGYYLVTSSGGALCSLTTTNPTVTIHDKNDVPFEKTDDRDSVEIGETVRYTITGKVPDATGFQEYRYIIKDTMSSGLSLQKNVAVTIGGTDVTGSCTLTYTPDDTNPTGFELTIPVKNYQTQVGAAISVNYSAIVNENAIAKVEKNRATLTYSNDPTDESSTETSPPQEPTVYSARIVIDKIEAGNSAEKLQGAKFVLMNGDKSGYYYYDESAKAVRWIALGVGETLEDVLKADYAGATTITEVTTDSTGAAQFIGLKDGTYYLLETEAPKGYNPLKEAVEVAVNGSAATETNVTPLTCTAQVANNTGAELPSTGGTGTTVFYAVGGALVLAAVVLLVVRRRMGEEK